MGCPMGVGYFENNGVTISGRAVIVALGRNFSSVLSRGVLLRSK